MKVSIYEGLQDELFCKLGKFAMDAALIKKLGNPITTDKDSVWVIISLGSRVVGFCRLKNTTNRNIISNVHLEIDNKDIFDKLLSSTFEKCKKGLVITSYANAETLPHFERNGFRVSKQGINWHTITKDSL